MGTGAEEDLKVAVIITAKIGEETSTTMGILVKEEEVKIHIKMVVALSTTATTKVKVRVMVNEVEATTTTTRATAGDEHNMSKTSSGEIVHVQPDMVIINYNAQGL
jgi:hypothetical protein